MTDVDHAEAEKMAQHILDPNSVHLTTSYAGHVARSYLALAEEVLELRAALKKIYEYRSDAPDWNMVMAIAGDAIDPQEAVLSDD